MSLRQVIEPLRPAHPLSRLLALMAWQPQLLMWLVIALAAVGCRQQQKQPDPTPYSDTALGVALTRIEYPDVEVPSAITQFPVEAPRTLRDLSNVQYWDLSLEETVRLALINSPILRDLGGAVTRAPDTQIVTQDPALTETDPRFGVEGALSAFDATLHSTLNAERTDRRVNNRFLGQLGFLQGDVDAWDTEIAKQNAMGTRFALRQHIDSSRDNNPGNQFQYPNDYWNVWYEAEARQSLLQGAGLQFNRIAGPGATPGVLNGVLLARIRTDITIAEFEIGLRDFISNVENAYWDLYYAYRDLDAKVKARDIALETWRRIQALNEAGRRGGEAEKEAQAREQYFRFESDVQDSLAGRPLDGTRTNNGSRPGTMRALPGVLVNERRLRLLMGITPEQNAIIRPTDEPFPASVVFEWGSISGEALARRSELRRQRWRIKQREMELLASRNFLMPKLDAFGTYRYRGFGDSLLDPNRDVMRFDNAFQDLTTGKFQEWKAGLEFNMTFGFRQAHAAVRNAELHLARERAILKAMEQEVLYDLAQSVAEMDRGFVVLQTNYNRMIAAREQVAAVQAAFEDDRIQFIAVLDAQRRLAEDEAQYYRSRTEYGVGLKNVHFEKGTLLDYLGVATAEGPWPDAAYEDAARKEANRGFFWRPRGRSPIISTGNTAAIESPFPIQGMAPPSPSPRPQQEISAPGPVPMPSPMTKSGPDAGFIHLSTVDPAAQSFPPPASGATQPGMADSAATMPLGLVR
jgi:outer membrane protein TolC